MPKNNKKQKNIKDASGKYEFANDQLGENIEPRYEDMTKDKKAGKKNSKK
ncbi:MAG TPA: hypothetical protein GXX73_07690 [Clostridium sp.]|nr:hypothetical protein [Clostridium sp.]